MNVTGKTKIVGVIGWPIEHSLSPAMHNAAFAALGLDFIYLPLPVQPEGLEHAVTSLKTLGFIGANVTIPYKVAIMPFLDEIDYTAQMVGAVNTIVIQEGRSIGYNTDANGFIQSLQSANVDVADKQVVVLGAGGAAQAIVCGLIEHKVRRLAVAARNVAKVQDFAMQFTSQCKLHAYSWLQPEFSWELRNCDLLIQCTPLGMSPRVGEEPPIDWNIVSSQAIVCDIIYNPPITRFLHQARQFGHKTVNGQGMLVEQGAIAFQLWTGQRAPRQEMGSVF